MKKLTSVFIAIFVNVIWGIPAVFGDNLADLASSAEIKAAPIIPAQITLQEVAFKNTEQDFLSFKVQTNLSEVNLRGLEFYDDKVFKSIDNDFLVKNNSQVKLFFNSSDADNFSTLSIHTSKKGLTATTEQLILKQGQHYFDFICWQKDPISQTEATEFGKIWQKDFWESSNINSCLDSSKVVTGQILKRHNNEPSASAWQVQTSSIKAAEASTQSPKTAAKKSTTSKTAPAKKTTTSKTSTIKVGADNDLPTDPLIAITEIYPAPTDKNTSEWVEVENLTDADINLQNWIIDDQDGGSTPKRLGALEVSANRYAVIELKNLKINLNNSADQVRLFRPTGQLEAIAQYDEIEKGKSFALITTDGEQNWEYTDKITPGAANPILNTIRGQIASPADFGEIYSFTLNRLDEADNPTGDQYPNEQYLVTFNEKIIKAPLAKATFVAGAAGSFTGTISIINQDGLDQKILQLNRYQIDSIPASTTDSPLLPIIGIILIVAGSGYFIFQKYQIWVRSQLGNYLSPS